MKAFFAAQIHGLFSQLERGQHSRFPSTLRLQRLDFRGLWRGASTTRSPGTNELKVATPMQCTLATLR